MNISNRRIILAPLNWGFGHASRCIPLIEQLLAQNNVIAIASDGGALSMLESRFPQLETFHIAPYDINYSTKYMLWNMLTQIPKLTSAIYNEHKQAIQLSEKWGADTIISDNRLGFFAPHTHSIYVTHQLDIPLPNPFLRMVANNVHHYFIEQYDECWIPDYKEIEHRLSGDMSQKSLSIQRQFIGPLTRMKKIDIEENIDITVVLSGPEPQRSILEQKLYNILITTDYQVNFVSGNPGTDLKDTSNLKHFPVIYDDELNRLISRSKLVISRAGYSTLMDLDALQKRAILIPTPGQYEQEYLANYHQNHELFNFMSQQHIESELQPLIQRIIC